MKKIIKTLTTLFTAALAVAGGLLIYQKFFRKEEELEEDLIVIEKICTEAQKYAPDFDCEQLYAEL